MDGDKHRWTHKIISGRIESAKNIRDDQSKREVTIEVNENGWKKLTMK